MVKLGSAFSDNVVKSDHARPRGGSGEAPWWAGAGRALVFATVLVGGFFVLSWRLFDLTVIHGLEYRKLSDNNRTRELVRHAPRGLLLDRTGQPLVTNMPQYRLLKPCTANGNAECVTYLSKNEGDTLSTQGLPAGEYLEVDYLRQYPYENVMAHIIGYTGELSGEELSSEYYKSRNYGLGDRVGRMGAEEVYNERLRGRDGKELVEVDAAGKMLRSLGRQEELPGEDISLSLDLGVAKAAAAAFPPGEKGAVIVSKPSSGEILAIYSSPGFSPNSFLTGMTTEQYQALMNDQNLPMFDRAIGGVYPPGSTFKLVVALAGLEEGTLKADSTVDDNGTITIGPYSFPNWYFLQYGKTEGTVDLKKAIQRSNDIFFYKAGEWLGITKLVSWLKKIGIGKPLGIELSGEASGLVPDPAWKNAHFHTEADVLARNNEWYLGDTYHMSIGQGYLLVTPLAVNYWTNIIASGGKLCKPTIGKLFTLKEQRNNCKDIGIHPESIHLITQGMEKACATGGTGWPLFNFSVTKATNTSVSPTGGQSDIKEASGSASLPKIQIPVACKTGTAEFGDPAKNRTHAWFTSFAPIPDEYIPDEVKATESYISGSPELSVTILVEGAGEGSNVAAPVAKKIFEEWFSR
jgi:penicillin-binding protein 2